MTTYIKNDLIDYAETLEPPTGRLHPRREEVLETMLPDTADIHVAREGSYQGELVLVVELAGYIWMAHDYYGSCSGCDACLSNPQSWGEDMLRRAYCFGNIEDAETYLNETMDFGWEGTGLKPKAQELLTDLKENDDES